MFAYRYTDSTNLYKSSRNPFVVRKELDNFSKGSKKIYANQLIARIQECTNSHDRFVLSQYASVISRFSPFEKASLEAIVEGNR